MEHYVSGEAHHEQLQEHRSTAQPKDRHLLVWATVAVIAVLISGLGIFIHSKHASHISPGGSTQEVSLNSGGTGCGSGNQCFVGNGPTACAGSGPCSQSNRPSPPQIGTVTALSASSITERLQDGTTQTFAITSNTQIGIGPGAPNKPYGPNYLSYIQVGHQVGIMADPSNSSQAQLVMPFGTTTVNTN